MLPAEESPDELTKPIVIMLSRDQSVEVIGEQSEQTDPQVLQFRLFSRPKTTIGGLMTKRVKVSELGEPDKYCTNPHYRSGCPASLYLIERVEAWIEENQERVAKAKVNRLKRSAAMTAVQAKKRAERWEKAQKWVNELPISIRRPRLAAAYVARKHW
jgi:hypothetical protein